MYIPDYIVHAHIKSRFSDAIDEWVKTYAQAISLIVKRNMTASQYQLYHVIQREVGRQGESFIIEPTMWVNYKGERHITVTITLCDIGKFKLKVLVPSLRTPEEIQTKARYDLGCLIGDLSQYVYECSYNDFDVFVGWKSKELNSYWSAMKDYEKDHLRSAQYDRLFIEYCPGQSYDWEALLDRLYELAQGWPTDWLATYQTVEELSTQHPYRYKEPEHEVN